MLKQQHGSSHGKWLAWLKEHVGIEDRTAQNYVKLARNKVKYETVSHLGVRQALKLAGKTSSAGDVDAGGETVCSLSDGRDIAGEDRSSEGDQASSGSRGQFVVAAKTYEVPQQRQYISPQVEPFAGPNGPRVNFDDLRVQQEMNAEIELLHRAQDIVKWIVPEGFSAVTTALRTLPAPFRELGTKLADKNEAVRPRAAH